MIILVTGFEPFAGVPHNPSASAVAALPASVAGCPVRTAVLPVDTDAIAEVLRRLFAEHRPAAVIHAGVAETSDRFRVETQAVNERTFRVPDNRGRALCNEPIHAGGPATLSSRLPAAAILSSWTEAGLPGELSADAGRYLCNQTLYLSLLGLPLDVPAGFIHLPPDEALGRQLGRPGRPLRDHVLALEIAVRSVS